MCAMEDTTTPTPAVGTDDTQTPAAPAAEPVATPAPAEGADTPAAA